MPFLDRANSTLSFSVYRCHVNVDFPKDKLYQTTP